LWDGNVFIESRILNVTLPTEQDLKVLVEISVGVTA
jgi:hypothetical protein